LVINSAINNGMSWEDIALMVEHETAAGWWVSSNHSHIVYRKRILHSVGNPIASLIHKLKLDKNEVILRLRNLNENNSDSDDSDNESKALDSDPFIDVEIDVS
jgi:hypothetical protein